ncbi:MAG: Na+/H+ antiporter subunit E [Candidatus Aegiribacteria sp.]
MSRHTISSVISSVLVLLIIWMFLTLRLHPQEIILGIVLSVIISFATAGAFTGNLLKLARLRRLIAAADYVFFFLGQMFMANIDVFIRVVKPKVRVDPGIVRASLPLKSPRARSMVANSITLTPGTLTVEMSGDSIFVHWISLPEGDPAGKTQKMVDGFARRLEKVFE